MPKYYFEFEQRSAAWTNIRLGKVTASVADQIITPGGKPSKQREKLMMKLLAEWVLGESSDNEYTSHWMERGIEQEESSVRAFEFQTGLETQAVAFVEHDSGLMGCSPDRLVGESATLELKNPAPFTQMSYLLTDSVADEYFVQSQFQLYVCEREQTYVASFHPKLPPVIMATGRNEKFITAMAIEMDNFCYDMLQKRAELEKRFGPFERPQPKQAAVQEVETFGITEADLETLWQSVPVI